MARMTREATEMVEQLIDLRLSRFGSPPPGINIEEHLEEYVAAKRGIAAEVVAKYPELTMYQVYSSIDTLTQAQLRRQEKEFKRIMRPRWLRWF